MLVNEDLTSNDTIWKPFEISAFSNSDSVYKST